MFNTPINWIDGQRLIYADFNEQIEENLNWLRDRNISLVNIRNGVSDWTQSTLNTWEAIDPTLLFVEITTNGGDILITANLNIRNSGASGGTLLDFYVQLPDGSGFYLSSLTASPLTDGLFEEEMGSSFSMRKSYSFLWINPPANSYKISVHWLAKVGSNSLNYTNTLNQLTVEEYGVFL